MARDDVVRVPVTTIWTEADNHIGPELANDPCDVTDQRFEVGVYERTVNVVETSAGLNAETVARAPQLRLTDGSECLPRCHACVANLTGLSPRDGNDHGFRARGDVLRERSAATEDFIVGMSEYAQKPLFPYRFATLSVCHRRLPATAAPVALPLAPLTLVVELL